MGKNSEKHLILHIIFLLIPEMTFNEILPDLAEASKDILEETLQSLGIETSKVFNFFSKVAC